MYGFDEQKAALSSPAARAWVLQAPPKSATDPEANAAHVFSQRHDNSQVAAQPLG